MNTFATLNAIMLDQKAGHAFYLFGCASIVAEVGLKIPWTDFFDWTETNHFCLPISVSTVLSKAEIKQRTTYNSSLKIPIEK